MEEIEKILESFTPISLEGIARSDMGLMDRVDSKYLLHITQLTELLKILKADYRVLEVEGERLSRYETLYFDTSDYSLYMMHHNKKGHRYKIRVRRYVENDLIFLEVKEKNNKGETQKKRTPLPFFPKSLEEIQQISTDLLPEGLGLLQPQLWTYFQRATLVNPISRERLTIDLRLRLKNEAKERQFEDMIVMEVKRQRNAYSPTCVMMKDMKLREAGFSKYSIGTAMIVDEVKKNAFKPRLLEIMHRFPTDEAS